MNLSDTKMARNRVEWNPLRYNKFELVRVLNWGRPQKYRIKTSISSGSPSWTRFELSRPVRRRPSWQFSNRFRRLRLRDFFGEFPEKPATRPAARKEVMIPETRR